MAGNSLGGHRRLRSVRASGGRRRRRHQQRRARWERTSERRHAGDQLRRRQSAGALCELLGLLRRTTNRPAWKQGVRDRRSRLAFALEAGIAPSQFWVSFDSGDHLRRGIQDS